MATVYQKVSKYLTGKDVEDPYPTKLKKYDKNKKLSAQLELNDGAVNMAMGAGSVGGVAGKIAKNVAVKAGNVAEKAGKVANTAGKLAKNAEQKAANVRLSRDPAKDISKANTMDVLGASANKPTLSYGKGGERASKPSVKELINEIQRKKAAGDTKSLKSLTDKWKQIKLDRK